MEKKIIIVTAVPSLVIVVAVVLGIALGKRTFKQEFEYRCSKFESSKNTEFIFQTMFWSKTKNLVRDLTKNRDDVVALEDTLLGSVLDGLTWCGEKGNSDFACDDVTAILDGSIDTPFDPERADCNNPSLKDLQRALDQGITYNCKEVTEAQIKKCSSDPKKPIGACCIFASIEVKRFDYPRVQSLNVVLVTQNKTVQVTNCTNASLKDLQKELDQGITYNCEEVTETQIQDCSSHPEKPCGACW
ncbi:hypothetical protein NQZ68_013768 [Dissostichus eleginoides]|nr:hypothetical protein NQZ68_013768 [Dissostichus eleginoides]